MIRGPLTLRSATLAVLVLAVAGPITLAAAPPGRIPRQRLTAGDYRVELTPRRGGLTIEAAGVVISSGSELVVTTPPWTPHYYVGPTEQVVAEAQLADDGTTLHVRHRDARGVMEARETLTLDAGGRLEQTLDLSFTDEGGKALVQWRMAELSTALIAGRNATARFADHEQTAIVPATPIADQDRATILQGFDDLTFDTRIGPLRVEVLQCPPLSLRDPRKSPWADPNRPHFWLGDLGTIVEAGQTLRYHLVYHLPPVDGDKMNTSIVRAQTRAARVASAAHAGDDKPTLVPQPREINWSEGHVLIRFPEQVSLQRDDGTRTMALAAPLHDLVERWKARAPADVRLDPASIDRQPELRLQIADPAASLPAEGYELVVDDAAITLRAPARRGLLYGLQTLMQLSQAGPRGIVIRKVHIRDWPALDFRGVHLFTGGAGPGIHQDLIRKVLAPLKFNHLVLECEYIRWDTQPAIHHPEFGMSKDDVRAILATCQEYGIEVTPLVQSLGHCQWMFHDDQNLELAEDPDAKWAYCVTNPATYDFIFPIFEEAIELFEPGTFHIGHDEFADRGRVPYRSAGKGLTVEDLLMQDTLQLHAWFAARGIEVMLWGDMFLGPGESPDACHAGTLAAARRRRARLPADVIVNDWHYAQAEPERFRSLATFQREGNRTVAAGWYRPGNITSLVAAARRFGCMGYLQTTWAGYSLDPASVSREMQQYVAYVAGGAAAWEDGSHGDPNDGAGQRFLDLMGMSPLPARSRAGALVNLAPACNDARDAAHGSGWFDLGPDHDLAALPAGQVQLHGIRFDLPPAGMHNLVALDGRLSRDLALPRTVHLDVAFDARELVILHATNFATRMGEPVARYTARLADGTSVTRDVIYGEHIFDYRTLTPATGAPILWQGHNRIGDAVAVRALAWSLPPDVRVTGLTFESLGSAVSPLIFGVTGLEAAAARRVEAQ